MINLICINALAWDLATNSTTSSRQNSGNLCWSIIKSYPPIGRPGTEQEQLFQCLIWGLQRDGEAQLSLSLIPLIETRFSWFPKQNMILHRTCLQNWEMHTRTEPLDHWAVSVLGLDFLSFIWWLLDFQRRNTKPEKNLLFYWLPVSWMSEFPQKLLKICLILSMEGGEQLTCGKLERFSGATAHVVLNWVQFIFLYGGAPQHFKIPILFGAPKYLLLFRYSKSIWTQSWIMYFRQSCLNREVGPNDFQWSFPVLATLWSPNRAL